jgi:hypothetical protein
MEAIIGPPLGAVVLASPAPVLTDGLLLPGVVLLAKGGGPLSADPRALALLGCRDAAGLDALWPHLLPQLAAAGLTSDLLTTAAPPTPDRPPGPAPGRSSGPAPERLLGPTTDRAGEARDASPAGALPMAQSDTCEIALAAEREGGSRRLRVSLLATADRPGAGKGASGVLLIQAAEVGAALDSDLRAAAQMRSLIEITPAVAHDLRAPINAMVLNLEVLKQTLAASPPPAAATPPAAPGRSPRERQQRYVHVLGEELTRLHKALEVYLAHISPRGERYESLDLREAAHDLAAVLRPLARKQQMQVEVLAPDRDLPVAAQRYLLRQALLYSGLAVLAQVPREGTLEIRLDRLAGRTRLRLLAASLVPLRGGRDDGNDRADGNDRDGRDEPADRNGRADSNERDERRRRADGESGADGGDRDDRGHRAAGGSGGDAGESAPRTGTAAGAAAAPRRGPTFSPGGTEARLAVAGSILALFGATLRDAAGGEAGDGRPEPVERGAASRAIRAFEIDFPLSRSN